MQKKKIIMQKNQIIIINIIKNTNPFINLAKEHYL